MTPIFWPSSVLKHGTFIFVFVGELDIDITINYLRSTSYIMTGEEERQVVYTANNPAPCYSGAPGFLNSQMFMVILSNLIIFITSFV